MHLDLGHWVGTRALGVWTSGVMKNGREEGTWEAQGVGLGGDWCQRVAVGDEEPQGLTPSSSSEPALGPGWAAALAERGRQLAGTGTVIYRGGSVTVYT